MRFFRRKPSAPGSYRSDDIRTRGLVRALETALAEVARLERSGELPLDASPRLGLLRMLDAAQSGTLEPLPENTGVGFCRGLSERCLELEPLYRLLHDVERHYSRMGTP